MQADGAVIFTSFLRKAWPKRSVQEKIGTTESLVEAEFEYPMPEEGPEENLRLSSIM